MHIYTQRSNEIIKDKNYEKKDKDGKKGFGATVIPNRANFTTLQKSYRTTIEIMDVANELLQQLDENLPLVEPVVRHGAKPKFIRQTKFQPKRVIQEVERLREKFNSIAFICKTRKEAENVAKELTPFLDVQLLEPSSTLDPKAKLLIVPSYLAKGLEFDAL